MPPDNERGRPASDGAPSKPIHDDQHHQRTGGSDTPAATTGRELADQGAQLVLTASPEGVKAELFAALEALAKAGVPFTSDDVWTRLDGRPHLAASANLIGAAFRTAASNGLIRPVGFRPSLRASRHGAIVRVWQGVSS